MRAVITGATGGIGKATCKALGKKGYDIVFTGISVEDGKKVQDELADEGINSEYYSVDATNEEEVKAFFDKLADKYGSIDVLVNNVGGLGGRQRISEMETNFMRSVMALNFDSAYFATRYAADLLKKGTNASIVNYSTIAVYSGGGPGASIYAASKGAIEGFTRGMAKDFAEFGIRVNAVSPGTVDTPFHSATKREIVESWKDNVLLKRLGQPEEVASVVEFLVSEKASFLTGEIIQINGGQAFI